MSYGREGHSGWMLGEEEGPLILVNLGCDVILTPQPGIKHIKAAYDMGINTFDTADFYSNGMSEVVLGKAIKQLQLPRDEIVVMTKVYFPVAHDVTGSATGLSERDLEKQRYANQHGLSRKVRLCQRF